MPGLGEIFRFISVPPLLVNSDPMKYGDHMVQCLPRRKSRPRTYQLCGTVSSRERGIQRVGLTTKQTTQNCESTSREYAKGLLRDRSTDGNSAYARFSFANPYFRALNRPKSHLHPHNKNSTFHSNSASPEGLPIRTPRVLSSHKTCKLAPSPKWSWSQDVQRVESGSHCMSPDRRERWHILTHARA